MNLDSIRPSELQKLILDLVKSNLKINGDEDLKLDLIVDGHKVHIA